MKIYEAYKTINQDNEKIAWMLIQADNIDEAREIAEAEYIEWFKGMKSANPKKFVVNEYTEKKGVIVKMDGKK